jgi:hypothetical protein
MASSVGAVVGFGVLPAPAGGAQVDISATPPGLWAVEAFGRAYGSQRRFVATGGASVHFAATSGGLAICPLHMGSARRLALDLCAAGELAAVESDSDGFGSGQSSTAIFFRLLAGTHVSVPLAGPLALRVGGELGIALVRHDFFYSDAGGSPHDLFDPVVSRKPSGCDFRMIR